MPKIPVAINEMPTDLPPMDESIPYHGIVRSCRLADETDKNGNSYLTDIRIEVLDPEEFKGRSAFMNYLVVPMKRITSELELGLPRFIKAFRIPYDDDGFDPSEAIGCEGDFLVRMEEYQGRKSARVADFLL